MILTTSELTFDILATYIRQNTGRSLCDSGDIYGRQYDRPIPATPAWFDASGDYALMSLGHWLIENCDYLPEIQEAFDDFAKGSDDTWEEDLLAFFNSNPIRLKEEGEEDEAKVYALKSSFYSYNHENGLDQDAVVFLFVHEDEWREDPAYAEDLIIAIQSHNGCDARGGFSSPFFLKAKEKGDASFVYKISPSVWVSCPGQQDRTLEIDQLESRITDDGASQINETMAEEGYTFESISEDRGTVTYRNEAGEVLELTVSIPYS